MKRQSILALVVLLFTSTLCEAELWDRGGGLIYDDVLDITWMQDANYFRNTLDGMDWDEAMLWASQLQFRGYSDWRLPDSPGTMQGFTNEGELGHLYYVTLGNHAGGPLTNTGPFTMLPTRSYWLSTPGLNPLSQWSFMFDSGFQNAMSKGDHISAWAVRDGDVIVIPLPSAVFLGVIGLSFAGMKLRKRKEL